ncbi:hypothetical protein B296_00058084 [Ensete ventricosum]|uniref:Uncharacterized protein n=1 Tax=Ensete ventricosum TaxID=4639 RepID=A0A426X153_ENSVE|nr:hypothetical protein B296_00058084 [Ensete ventricosum]
MGCKASRLVLTGEERRRRRRRRRRYLLLLLMSLSFLAFVELELSCVGFPGRDGGLPHSLLLASIFIFLHGGSEELRVEKVERFKRCHETVDKEEIERGGEVGEAARNHHLGLTRLVVLSRFLEADPLSCMPFCTLSVSAADLFQPDKEKEVWSAANGDWEEIRKV